MVSQCSECVTPIDIPPRLPQKQVERTHQNEGKALDSWFWRHQHDLERGGHVVAGFLPSYESIVLSSLFPRLVPSSGLSLSPVGFTFLLLLLKSLLFPGKDVFEHDPQDEDGNEHEDLLPCAQLDGFEQRCC